MSSSSRVSTNVSARSSKYSSHSRIGSPVHTQSTFEFSRVTEEDRQLAFLGFKDLNKSVSEDGTVHYREEFCGACGIIHSNPDLLDMYYNCKSCHCTLREPSVLRKKMCGIPQGDPLEILYATYGDPFDPELAIDVTKHIIKRVQESSAHDRLSIKPIHKMNEIFGCDPCPGRNKQLRIRYRIGEIHSTLILDFLPTNTIPAPFLLLLPRTRYLRIFTGQYGHPKGISSTGRMSYDVVEILQSLVDQNGGSYLSISSMTPIARIFGDPCPGYPKDLRLSFEVCGRSGSVTYSEVRGHLRKRLFFQSSPTVAPILFVQSATYGITPTGRRDRLEYIAKQLRRITLIEHRRREGIHPTPEEVVFLKSKPEFLHQRQMFQDLPTNFIDISIKMQKMADKGITRLFLDKETFDPNFVFGNPSEGNYKILECCIDCQGHDSEQQTELNEMTDTGYTRNFITVKKKRFNILVKEDPETGIGYMCDSLDFATDYAAPIIIITRATYGELHDMTKIIDVTIEIQNLVKGRTLTIDRDVDLNKLFKKDPSPGKRKQLKVAYVTRGFQGNLRVREKEDLLVAGIELGYPPVPPPDDDDVVIN